MKTWRDIVAEMREQDVCYACRAFSYRIESACKMLEDLLIVEQEENEKLRRALEPVMKCDCTDAFSTANTIANNGTLPSYIDYDRVSSGIYRVCNAVRKSQEIMKEGAK